MSRLACSTNCQSAVSGGRMSRVPRTALIIELLPHRVPRVSRGGAAVRFLVAFYRVWEPITEQCCSACHRYDGCRECVTTASHTSPAAWQDLCPKGPSYHNIEYLIAA